MHHEMARYDLPTYVLHVLGHFWMFAVKITEWFFFQKKVWDFGPTFAVGVRKSAEGRAPVAMQLVQLLQLVFFDTTEQPVNR